MPIVDNYYLVHWPEEDSASVVFGNQLLGETKIGEVCKIKLNRNVYEGKLLSKGIQYYIHVVRVHVYVSILDAGSVISMSF